MTKPPPDAPNNNDLHRHALSGDIKYVQVTFTLDEGDLLLRALLKHNGASIAPEWPDATQSQLSIALDMLRAQLLSRVP